jgi:pyruvate,water dikinase
MSLTFAQVWGCLLITIACPLLGGLPLINWLTRIALGQNCQSVREAFVVGGNFIGILAIMLEAAKGILVVAIAAWFFPGDLVWQILALIALILGRYLMAKKSGMTSALWGTMAIDPLAAIMTISFGAISLTLNRDRRIGNWGLIILCALIFAIRHPQDYAFAIAAFALSTMLVWLDAELSEERDNSTNVYSFWRRDRGILSLKDRLDFQKVGRKAANLSYLKKLGYAVPDGWVMLPGDDLQALIEFLEPNPNSPLIVRSSATDEDSISSSAAGQYLTIANIVNKEELERAILDCLASYDNPGAVAYRRRQQEVESSMALIVQKQVRGVCGGVAFSRDPLNPLSTSVLVEALLGEATQVAGGQLTPQQYRVDFTDDNSIKAIQENLAVPNASVPLEIIESVALLAREMETIYKGIPQDLEWTYDGEKIWVLQTRPITNLQPIWTRQLTPSILSGKVRPLAWSIHRPLILDFWERIFVLLLGKQVSKFNLKEIISLNYSRLYFNLSLLKNIWHQLKLPQDSFPLEQKEVQFLKIPWLFLLTNFTRCFKLIKKEINLEKNFDRDCQSLFDTTLRQVNIRERTELSSQDLLERIEILLLVLHKITAYKIFTPLSVSWRQQFFKVEDRVLDRSNSPEIIAMRALAYLARDASKLLAAEEITLNCTCSSSLVAHLAEVPDGESVLQQLDSWLENYGYLSEDVTDLALYRWKDNPRALKEIFTQFAIDKDKASLFKVKATDRSPQDWKAKLVQQRLDLEYRVTEIYCKVLAHLRWSFLVLEEIWLRERLLETSGDIFFLEFTEILRLIRNPQTKLRKKIIPLLRERKEKFARNAEISSLPLRLYGSGDRAVPIEKNPPKLIQLRGIGISVGIVEGSVKVLRNLEEIPEIDRQTILVVPHTNSHWVPILARAGGLISQVGGRLSHGAIVAREYGIPAVSNIPNATYLLKNGQRLRLDGEKGTIDLLD